VSELEVEYAGRVRFAVRDVNTDEGQAAVEKYGWQEALHGLVTLDADGNMVGTIPGHRYGKEEVQAKVEELIAATPR
jgi:hypothetical protein